MGDRSGSQRFRVKVIDGPGPREAARLHSEVHHIAEIAASTHDAHVRTTGSVWRPFCSAMHESQVTPAATITAAAISNSGRAAVLTAIQDPATCLRLGGPAFCQKQHFAARRSCCLTTPVLMPRRKVLLPRRGPAVFSSSFCTLFPTDRFEFADLLLIHKLASLSAALRPVLLAHRLSFKLAALSLVAVPWVVRRLLQPQRLS